MLLRRLITGGSPVSAMRQLHTEKRISDLGYTLPKMPEALGVYVPAVRSGSHIFTAGHIPFTEDMQSIRTGKVGVEYTTEEGAKLAEWIGLELLAVRIKSLRRTCSIWNVPH